MDADVYFQNPPKSGYASQIRLVRPDVATIEERTPYDVAQIRSSGALAARRYQFEVFGTDPFIFCLTSHYQLSRTHVEYSGREALVVEIAALPSGPEPRWVIHTTASLPSSFGEWKSHIAKIDRLVSARGTRGPLLAGDVISTWNNKGFRQIMSMGLVDAATACSDTLAMTWTQTMGPGPPFVQIDHVLTSPEVAVTWITTGHGPGSHHRYLVAAVTDR